MRVSLHWRISTRRQVAVSRKLADDIYEKNENVVAFGHSIRRTRRAYTVEEKTASSVADAHPIVFCMAEHVIVSFTYNCNNDALVRVLNYLFIVWCFERTSHLNKWPSIVHPKGLMKAFVGHKDNAIDAASSHLLRQRVTCYDVLISVDSQSP